MPQQDLVECDHVRKRFKGTAYYSYYNPDHKWYYLGEQKPDEVTFLKIFDSDSKGGAKSIFSHLFSSYYTYDYQLVSKSSSTDTSILIGCPHTSFKHPNSPAHCPPRESIEVRALVFNYPPGILPPHSMNGTRIATSSTIDVVSGQHIDQGADLTLGVSPLQMTSQLHCPKLKLDNKSSKILRDLKPRGKKQLIVENKCQFCH